MPRPQQTEIRLRLIILNPVPGVFYSLQDKTGAPVSAQLAKDRSLSFNLTLRVADGPKFLGDHVRAEGAIRRFIYIAVGKTAGQAGSPWTRRMKIDIHTIPPAAITKAIMGKVLEAVVEGAGRDGTPACATVTPVMGWRPV